MENTKKILAVSWVTQYCQATVRAAIALANKFDAELSVIHVVDTQLLQGWNLPLKFLSSVYFQNGYSINEGLTTA